MEKIDDVVTIGLLGFLGGLVSNIIEPSRRGLLGFAAAATVGLFVGGVVGMIAMEYQLHTGLQYLCAAGFGVLGDRLLTVVLAINFRKRSKDDDDDDDVVFNILGNNHQVNVGNKGISAEQNVDKDKR